MTQDGDGAVHELIRRLASMEVNERSPLLQERKESKKEKDKDKENKDKEKGKDKAKSKGTEEHQGQGSSKEKDKGDGNDKKKEKEHDKEKKKDKEHKKNKKGEGKSVWPDENATGGLHEMLGTEDIRPSDIDFDISVLCCCCNREEKQEERCATDHIHHQHLHQRYLVHVLCTIIMGADVTLDILQTYDYGQYGDKTHDLFVASLCIMSVVPAGLAILLACYASHKVIRIIYDFFVGKDNFQWGFFFGMFIWCIAMVLAPILLGTFVITVFVGFPLMVIAVVITPAYGMYAAWKYIYSKNQYRIYYFIRYTQGLVCAFPHFIIDVIFMHRMGAHSAQAVASAIFSAVSVCQVCYQAFGLKRAICRCKKDTCVSLDGYGTLKDIIKGKNRIVEPKCNCNF